MVEPGSVAIVIVGFNSRAVLRACLESVREACWPGDEVIVVDNASGDGTIGMVRAEFPEVRLIANDANLGFAAACNQGVAAARAEIAMLLNPDARLTAGALAGLRSIALACDGLAGPQLRNEDGSVQRSAFRFPTPAVLFAEQLGLGNHLRALNPGDAGGADCAGVAVDWLKGACLVARTALLRRYGPFDEQFFMFSEDTDLAYRLHRDGIPVRYCPHHAVTHIGGMSTRLRPRAMTVLFADSMFRFYRTHYGRHRNLLAAAAMGLTASLKAVRIGSRSVAHSAAGRDAEAQTDRRAARTFLAVVARSAREALYAAASR